MAMMSDWASADLDREVEFPSFNTELIYNRCQWKPDHDVHFFLAISRIIEYACTYPCIVYGCPREIGVPTQWVALDKLKITHATEDLTNTQVNVPQIYRWLASKPDMVHEQFQCTGMHRDVPSAIIPKPVITTSWSIGPDKAEHSSSHWIIKTPFISITLNYKASENQLESNRSTTLITVRQKKKLRA